MSYPFAGSPQAQSSSDRRYRHADPYSDATQDYAPYPTQSSPDQGQDSSDAVYQRRPANFDNDEHGHYDDDLATSRAQHLPAQSDSYPQDRGGYPSRSDRNSFTAGAGEDLYSDTNNQMGSRMAVEKGAYSDPYSGLATRGKSIWTRDDKRAFQQRSVPARIFRVLFCILVIAVIFALSIICLIVMFARPPNVAISGVAVASNAVKYSNGAFSFNVTVDISISNPNSISATIKKLNAKAYDARDRSTTVGSGEVRDEKIVPHANTTIPFPFAIEYDSSKDTDLSIITDIASKCGLSLPGLATSAASGAGNLEFDLDIHVDISVLSITVPVSFSQDISFPCPLSADSLQNALGGLLGGVAGRSLAADEEQEALVRRQVARSPVELVAAAANELVKRAHLLANRASVVDVHDAL